MKITDNFLVVSSYNNDVAWVPRATDNYLIYDRSEVPLRDPSIDPKKIVRQPNVGYNLYDYFTFIIDRYDTLPDCTIFMKGNTVPRHVTQGYFESVMNNHAFTAIEDPIVLTANPPISFFTEHDGYTEINNSWYLNHHAARYFHSYNDFLRFCFKDPVIPRYVRFVPGGNYIVPKENILKLPKQFYENLRSFIGYAQLPGEAHIIERALYTLWTSEFTVSENMLRPFNGTTSPLRKIGLFKRKLSRKAHELKKLLG